MNKSEHKLIANDDLQWEIEAEESWDNFFLEHGIDRDAVVRAQLDWLMMPFWKRLWTVARSWLRGS